MPVKRCISFGYRFQFIVEINHNLAQRHVKKQLHSISADIFLLHQFAAFTKAKTHNWTYIIACRNHRCANERLLYAVYLCDIGHTCRVVYLNHAVALGIDIIAHIGNGGYYIHVKLTVQTLLHNLHMEQSKESTAETKAKRHRTLRLESETGVIELQFL